MFEGSQIWSWGSSRKKKSGLGVDNVSERQNSPGGESVGDWRGFSRKAERAPGPWVVSASSSSGHGLD